MALRPSGKFLSTELWILLASWHVTLKKFAASTMRTCLLTMCALALAPVCSERQTQYIVARASFLSHIIIPTSPLDVYYASATKLLKLSLRGARQYEACLAHIPSGKSISTELWILPASWHVVLRKSVPSTIRTCLLTMCALALAPVCSGVPLVCVALQA